MIRPPDSAAVWLYSYLPDQLVVILVSPLHHVCLVVPVLPGPVAVDVGVDASPRRKRHLGHQANNFKSPLATLPKKEDPPTPRTLKMGWCTWNKTK